MYLPDISAASSASLNDKLVGCSSAADRLFSLSQVVAVINALEDLGTITGGTVTINVARRYQKLINGGSFTIAAPATDGQWLLLVTNDVGAGTIDFSGFSVGMNIGDDLDTSVGNKFSIKTWRINGVSGYAIYAHGGAPT